MLFFDDLVHSVSRSEIDNNPIAPSGRDKMRINSQLLVRPTMLSPINAVASDASSRTAMPIHERAADRAIPSTSPRESLGNGCGAGTTASSVGAGGGGTAAWAGAG